MSGCSSPTFAIKSSAALLSSVTVVVIQVLPRLTPRLYECDPLTVYVEPDRLIVPVEDLPSPQLIVAVKAPEGSRPFAWVNVATTKPERFLDGGWMGPVTVIAGSLVIVVADALLLPDTGSADVAVTVAELMRLPSSVAWAVTVMVAVTPYEIEPRLMVTTLPDTLIVAPG